MFRKFLLTLVLLSPFVIYAQEPSSSKWTGEAELGYLKTSGNTDTESLHAKGKIVNERPKWRHTGTIEVVNKSDKGVDTADRLYVTGKSDYQINGRSYLFVMLSYDDDRFSGFDYQTTESVGYGYHVIKEEDLRLDVEVGAGDRQNKFADGRTSSEGLLRAAGDLEWKLSKTSTFTQALSVESGEDVTISRSLTGLKMQINGNLAAKLAYNVKHTSDVPPGFEKTDKESIVTLVYSFK